MKKHPWTRLVMLGLVLAALAPATGRAQAPERFGTVDFPNSCAPAVQEAFLRSVAVEGRPLERKPEPPADTKANGDTRPLVVIDPGHGGIDNGTRAASGEM